MTCRRVDIGGGFAIICSRERRKPCSTVGCTGAAVALCDWPLSGRKAGKTCDRALCASCRRPQAPDVDYCPAHHSMKKETEAR